MSDRQGLDASVERLLSGLIGHAVARTIVKQAHTRAPVGLGDDPGSARAFVRGPLLDVLSPLVGRGEAARLAHKVERSLAEERDWPVPEEDTLPGARRSSNPGGNGMNER
ncbi:MAG: hypothetical protein K1X94_00450 [Sandaracinaceae bacterium]|jgi:hypothetical protein|nr:hypothetical protein [Sandaracinaceae bacterium]